MKKRDGFWFSVFERAFFEWEDRTQALMLTYKFCRLILKHFLNKGGGGGALGFLVCGFGQFFVRFVGFGVLCGFRFFSNLVFGFRFLSTMMAVFRILLPNAFYGFPGFAREVTPRSRAKTVIV